MEPLKKIFIDFLNEWRPHRLKTLADSYPATAILCSVSLTTFIVVQSNFLIQLLAFVVYYLDIVARVMFGWLYPAALVSVIVGWCTHVFSIDTDQLALQYGGVYTDQWPPAVTVSLKVVLCITIGQLTLFCLPPIVNFFAMPFASAPTLLFTIVFSIGVIGYGLFLVLRQTLPGALQQERPGELARISNRNVDVGGDNDTCVVCLTNPKTRLIKPCNHFCACEECIRHLNECPLCKRPINMHERIYST